MCKLRANSLTATMLAGALALASGCGKNDRDKDRGDVPEQPPLSGDAVPEGCSDVGNTKPVSSPIFMLAAANRAKCHAFYVKVDWVAGPKTGEGNSALRLTFADAQGRAPTTVADVAFKPWMTVHDHGAPMRKQSVEVDPVAAHVYQVNGINFIMGGPWDLIVTASVNGHADHATAAVQVP